MKYIKQICNYAFGKELKIKKGILCNYSWYGNQYGGFYVCPDILNENSIIYSFGIGEDISFDLDLISDFNCTVYGFDPTPKSINWIKTQILPVNFNFNEYGISNKSGMADFYLPVNPDYVSGSLVEHNSVCSNEIINVFVKSMDDILIDLGHTHIDVLKMDIEGSEFDVIESVINSKVNINQLLIEFHHRFFNNGKIKAQRAIRKLKESGYEVFAFSDTFKEVSFIHKRILGNDLMK